METPIRKTHPMILIAAASVTIVSLAGAAALAGWLPGKSEAAATPVAQVAMAAQSSAAMLPVAPEKTANPNTSPTSPTTSVASKPAEAPPARRAATPQKTATAAPKPAPIFDSTPRDNERSTMPVSNTQTNDSGIFVENSRQTPAICHDCGTIESIREIAQEGQGTGLGAVAGGVLGGLLGNQIGNGSGRKVATVAGVLGGAYAGHAVEKNTRSSQQFQVTIRLDDGSMRTITETEKPAWQRGDRVRVSKDQISAI